MSERVIMADVAEPVNAGVDDIEVVLVSYRSRHHVEELVAGWPAELAVVVVDNSQNIDGVAGLADQHANLRYLSGGGQGFARAANLGASTSEKPYVLLVNPDCRPTVDQLLELVRGVAADAGSICHAATPVTPAGEIEIGVGGWQPSVFRTLVHTTGLHFLFPRWGLFAHPRLGEHVDVDWVTGTCMAVRRAPFLALGGFDEVFFVYCEDVAFGDRARAGGWTVRLRDDVLVPHGAGSSGAPSSEMRRLQGASFATYTMRYCRPVARGMIIRALYGLGALWRLALLTVQRRTDRVAATRAILAGVVTRRAYVGGVEVARQRASEVGALAHPSGE